MDTTSTALASVFFYICHYPEIKARLTAEIRETFPRANSIQLGSELNSCKYLTACIQECMRMSPSAGGSLWREVQVGGATVDNHFVPAGVDVGTGIYAMHHNGDFFPNPHEFDPDRWFRADGATTAAFAPFSIGPRGCVGKPLSMIELRLVTAFILWNYDLKLADGALGVIGGGGTGMGPGRERLHEFQLFDHINAISRGPLVTYRARENKKLDQGGDS
jgi:cytochrome P450